MAEPSFADRYAEGGITPSAEGATFTLVDDAGHEVPLDLHWSEGAEEHTASAAPTWSSASTVTDPSVANV